jgi:hypothetical protein
MDEQNSALDQLKKAVIGQKSASIPERGHHPELQRAFDLLLGYDEAIARAAIEVIQGLKPDLRALAMEPALSDALSRLSRLELGDETQLAQSYRARKDQIDRLRDLLLQATQQGGRTT